MKRYNAPLLDDALSKKGYAQEGYENILSFNLWISLNKIALTKKEIERNSLDVLNMKSLQELYDFVDLCKEQMMDNIEFHYDHDEDYLEGAQLIAFAHRDVKKSESELINEYFSYAQSTISRNEGTFKKFNENKQNEKKEFEHYLLLKEKYEGKK